MSHDQDDNQSGSGTTGSGTTGEIRFRYKETLSEGPRDDALAIHKDIHKSYVDKQKMARKERKLLKEGQNSLTARQETHKRATGSGGGSLSRNSFKKHPISNKAQFSGIDRQITALPSENMAETNEIQKNELQNRNELRNTFENTPKFNPKPRPY